MFDRLTSLPSQFAAGLLGLASLTPGCSAVDLANRLTPTGGLTVQRDVAYGPGERQRLDVYLPDDRAEADKPLLPVVIFIYGGSWQSGSKADYLFAAQAFTSRGYAVVVPDYRLYPEARYPDFLRDTAAAVAWVFEHAQAIGGDSGRVFLVGHSAGAYNAVMMGLDTPFLAELGIDRQRLRGIVGLAGPYDFLPTESPALREIFDSGGEPEQTQPINHVLGDIPPMLLLHGLSDTTVRPENTQALAEALKANGSEVQTVYYPEYDHIDIIGALAWVFRGRRPVMGDIAAWMDEQE